uniref:PlsC domain-containing protein n=1 Tax=Trichuris muris TaxID=70415 RepID=A0A5S6Q7Q6_TRIMR
MSTDSTDHLPRKAQWPGNPFENWVKMEPADQIKVAVFSILLAPLRFLFAFLVLALAFLLAIVTVYSMDAYAEAPLTGWRRNAKDIVAWLIVVAHFVIGFGHVKVKGRRASPTEAPILVLAPHCSFFDALPVCWIGAPSVVCKKSLVTAPIIGKLLQLTVPILVDRTSKDSRCSAMQKIRERATTVVNDRKLGIEWPQIAIFPEGTCTNRTQLISFKPGAFAMRMPVQPVCIKWPNKYDVISWTWEGNGVFEQIWLALCQLRLNVEIEFLPVYVPSEAEKNDALLFAGNVRSIMADCLRVPTSDYSYEDAPYLSYSRRPRLNVFRRLSQQLNVSTTAVEDLNLLKLKWTALRNLNELRRCGYAVPIDHFVSYLKLAPIERPPELQRLFNMFDWQCRRRIDLREYLIVSCVGDSGTPSMEYQNYCISIFADGEKQPISEVDFVKVVRLPKQISVAEARLEYSSYIDNFSLRPFNESCGLQNGINGIHEDPANTANQKALPLVRQLCPVLPLTLRRRCVKAC